MRQDISPALTNAAALFGRVALAIVFLPAGLMKIADYAGTAGYMASAGMPMIGILLPLAILVEVGGGLMLLAGFGTRLAALALAGFTVIATPIFHAWWGLQGMEQVIQQTMFFKNIGLVGGLAVLFAFGAGEWALDGRRAVRVATA